MYESYEGFFYYYYSRLILLKGQTYEWYISLFSCLNTSDIRIPLWLKTLWVFITFVWIQLRRKASACIACVLHTDSLCMCLCVLLSSQVLRWHQPPTCHQWSGYECLSGWTGSPPLQWVQRAQCPAWDLRLRQQVQPRGEVLVTQQNANGVRIIIYRLKVRFTSLIYTVISFYIKSNYSV